MTDEREHGADAPPAEPIARPQTLYRVRLPVFEGPLDLLLHLIKKNEVEITDIPIAQITEQYLAYLEFMRECSLDVAGEFLVMAATLTLIKSRLLLPPADGETEEEEADPRADLVRQLLEYQRFREAALDLSERPLLHRDVFVREPTQDVDDASADTRLPRVQATVWELLQAFRAVLQRARPETVHEVIADRVSLRDRVQTLLHALSTARALEFDRLFDAEAGRFEIIITFLAVLELMKLGAIRALQTERYGRIVIELAVADVSAVSLEAVDEYERSAQPAAGED